MNDEYVETVNNLKALEAELVDVRQRHEQAQEDAKAMVASHEANIQAIEKSHTVQTEELLETIRRIRTELEVRKILVTIPTSKGL